MNNINIDDISPYTSITNSKKSSIIPDIDINIPNNTSIQPSRSINFIGLTFVATRTGISFEEVVGRV